MTLTRDAQYYERRNQAWFDLIRQCVREDREPPKREEWDSGYDAMATRNQTNARVREILSLVATLSIPEMDISFYLRRAADFAEVESE